MNQMLTEHHIAQYNILLIEDHTANQTVSASSATPSWFWSIDDKPG